MKYTLILLCSLTLILSSCSSSTDETVNPAPIDHVSMSTGSGAKGLFGEDVSSVSGSMIENGELRGFYAEPTVTVSGEYPGVVMIHEWWGLNDNIKYMAKLLAKSGYRVFAIDLYDGEVATEMEDAKKLSTSVYENPEKANEKMKLAINYLKDTGKTAKIGTLGWCFGGAQSLNVSLETPVDATVVYYGNLVQDRMKLERLKGPLLGIFGDKDTVIPFDQIKLFQKNLTNAKKDYKVYVYPGLGHAFANPSGQNYAEKETLDAWKKTTDFLAKNLKQ